MSGAIIHSPNTPSWRGAQLKHRDNFTFTLYINIMTMELILLLQQDIPVVLSNAQRILSTNTSKFENSREPNL
jgi:hypothetical protein